MSFNIYIYTCAPPQSPAPKTMMLSTPTLAKTPSLFAKFRGLLSPKKPPPARMPMNFERVFRYFDQNGDGKISPAELQSCMRTVGEDLTHEDAEAVVEISDTDGDGLLCMDDFARLVDFEGEEEEGRSIREAFAVYETEGRGCITAESLRRALGRLGEKRSVKECKAMIREFDINGDGVICFEEFRIMML